MDVILSTRTPTMKLWRILMTVRGGDPIVGFPNTTRDSIGENGDELEGGISVNVFAFLIISFEFRILICIRSYRR